MHIWIGSIYWFPYSGLLCTLKSKQFAKFLLSPHFISVCSRSSFETAGVPTDLSSGISHFSCITVFFPRYFVEGKEKGSINYVMAEVLL